ncbi:MAG: ferredoxin [Nanobdellota archaeon]
MVKVDQDKCIGCGACAATCPQVFEMGDDGKSHIKANADEKKNAKCIKEAIQNCPVEAISK